MGGSVTALIRFSNGDILGKRTWTNRLFHMTRTKAFFTEDREYINGKLFALEDDECVSPVDYGIVFFDFLKKEVFSIQDYANPGAFHLLSVARDLDMEKEVNELIQCGYITEITENHIDLRDKTDEPKKRTSSLEGVSTIAEYLINHDSELKEFIHQNKLDKKIISLGEIEQIQSIIKTQKILNPNMADIIAWCKDAGIDVIPDDFENSEKEDFIKNITMEFVNNYIASSFLSIKDYTFNINHYTFTTLPSEKYESYQKLKEHLDNEGILFSDSDNLAWDSFIQNLKEENESYED